MKFLFLFSLLLNVPVMAEDDLKPIPQSEADFAINNPVQKNILKDIGDQSEGTGTWGGGDSALYALTEDARLILSNHAQLIQNLSSLNYELLPKEAKKQYIMALAGGLIETVRKSTVLFLPECKSQNMAKSVVFELKKKGAICIAIDAAPELKKQDLSSFFLQIHIQQVLNEAPGDYQEWLSKHSGRSYFSSTYGLMMSGWNLSFPISQSELIGNEERKCLYVQFSKEEKILLKDFPKSETTPLSVRQDLEGNIWIKQSVGIAKCLP